MKTKPLLEQYLEYFNGSRNAQIKIIGERDDGGGGKQIVIQYDNGQEVPLDDVLSWTQLFDKLDQLHPKKTQ